MLYSHFTQEVLGLQDVIITKVENSEKELIIYFASYFFEKSVTYH